MFTQHVNPAPALTARPRSRLMQAALLGFLALSMAACGGGSGDAGKSAKPPAVGTVIVKVTDSAGTPIRGASVALHAAVNSSDPITDDNGEVVFKNTLAGEREASAAKQGDFAPTHRFVVTPGSVNRLSLIIDHRRAGTR